MQMSEIDSLNGVREIEFCCISVLRFVSFSTSLEGMQMASHVHHNVQCNQACVCSWMQLPRQSSHSRKGEM